MFNIKKCFKNQAINLDIIVVEYARLSKTFLLKKNKNYGMKDKNGILVIKFGDKRIASPNIGDNISIYQD